MASMQGLLIVLLVSTITLYQGMVDGASTKTKDGTVATAVSKTLKDFVFTGGANKSIVARNRQDFQLVLDKASGSGVLSKEAFLFGSIDMQIKLVPNNSAGTVTAYYMASPYSSTRDEIDFEFLGNVSGQPYICHTNIYTQGNGSKEQQFYLWFDPTANFHTYSIQWTPYKIVWLVDYIPIRVFRNYQSVGIAFPTQKGMNVKVSLWNADNWATQGGRVKIDWNCAPFIASFKGFRAKACKWKGPKSIRQCSANKTANWWTSPTYSKLNRAQLNQLNWVRSNYMIYDYCKDTKRFNGNMPPECSLQQY